jgi:hypothetical protein
MVELEKKALELKINEEFLGKDDPNTKIDSLFKELIDNLEKRLKDLPKTQDGKDTMKLIIEELKKKIDEIKEADKEMTTVFNEYLTKRKDLGINEELKDIYNELFFLQVKLINDTFYKINTFPGVPKEIKPNLNELFKAFHQKIKLLNDYIKIDSLEKKS